jgi:hypothetical protein
VGRSTKTQYKRAIRHVLLKNRITKADYQSINILPLKEQLKLNKVSLVHKTKHSLAPKSLSKLFEKNPNRNYHNEFGVCSRPRLEFFMKSLQYSGGVLWNDLPNYMKAIKHPDKFRFKYKNILFSEIL